MTVTADDGTVFRLPPEDVIARYAVALYGEGHDEPLDNDSLVTIAAQVDLDERHGVSSAGA